MLYTDAEKQALKGQLIRRILLTIALFLAVFSGAIIVMFTSRQMWLSMVFCGLAVAAAVFFYGFFVSPFIAYYRYLKDVFEGKHREFCAQFLRSEEVSVRDGVPMQSLYFSGEHGQTERLCYLDAEKSFPFEENAQYKVTVHGQSVIGVQAI